MNALVRTTEAATTEQYVWTGEVNWKECRALIYPSLTLTLHPQWSLWSCSCQPVVLWLSYERPPPAPAPAAAPSVCRSNQSPCCSSPVKKEKVKKISQIKSIDSNNHNHMHSINPTLEYGNYKDFNDNEQHWPSLMSQKAIVKRIEEIY